MLAVNADIEQDEEDDELFGPGMAPPRKTREEKIKNMKKAEY